MKKISVQELKPGSVLGREVVSREGVVLLEKGGRLTKTAIATLFAATCRSFMSRNRRVSNVR
jgi:hypothetical protein